MASHPYECEYCHDLHQYPIGAALCCDPAAHAPTD